MATKELVLKTMNDDPVIAKLKKSKEFKKKGNPAKIPGFYLYVASQVKISGLWLEFGTGLGATIAHIAKYAPDTIYTFDWFRGLPEEWVLSEEEVYDIGTFGVYPITSSGEVVRDITDIRLQNVRNFIHVNTKGKAIIIEGLFEDTLPEFVKEHSGDCALIHIDCDLYSSTKTVFNYLERQIVPRTVIIFDEFYNYVNYKEHEYKAFLEFIDKTGLEYEFIAHVSDARQAALILR